MKRNNKKGFTIVELVIVIAVIAILSAVMIPTFSGVVGKAEAAADRQNARNEYTEYLVEHPTAEIDYVYDGTTYYDVADEFKAEETDPTTGTYLDMASDSVKTIGSN